MTGQQEEIIGNINHSRFKDVGCPRRSKTTPYQPVVFHYDPEYMAQCVTDMEEHLTRLRRLQELVMEERREECLADRISTERANDTPLAERITPIYTPPKPIPNINFKKIKIQKRQQEMKTVINAAQTRINIFKKFAASRRPRQDLEEEIGKFLERFESFVSTFDERAQKYSNKQWRIIKVDLKSIKSVPLYDLERNWEDICSEFAALGMQKRFVYTTRA